MSDNPEFYPLDFPQQVVVSPEELLRALEERIIQSLFQQLAQQRRAQSALIAAEKARMVVGERLPSPSVAVDFYGLDIANKNATLEQYQQLSSSMMALMIEIQKWQTATLEPVICGDVTSPCSD